LSAGRSTSRRSDLEGARWIGQNADVFLFLVDCDALAGPDRGEARTNTNILAQRLSDELHGRPVAVVWAKSDIAIKKPIRDALAANFSRLFEHYKEFSVSVEPIGKASKATGDPFMKLLSWLLESRRGAKSAAPMLSIDQAGDPMLAFRGYFNEEE